MTGREALRWAIRRLSDPECPDDGRECERKAALLLGEAAGLNGVEYYNALPLELPEPALMKYRELVERAEGSEPVQYILGRWDFYGHTFRTDRRALIPRPETERLAEEALKAIPADAVADVLDAGCGTGCIGIAIKLARPKARVTLCDISDGALSLAGENAELLDAQVALLHADMRLPLPGAPYDAIVSNPPYINAEDMGKLPVDVREHEPALALFGGEDGMDFIRALVDRAGDSLKPGGRLFVEVGYDQAARAVELMNAAGMNAVALHDYEGILRVVIAGRD